MNEFIPIESSSGNILAAKYDAETKDLFVRFKGNVVYKYPDFEAEKFQEFAQRFDGNHIESAGTYFYREIRNLPNEKVENV